MSSGGALPKGNQPPCRVAVIGGGITGLTAAFRLQNRLPLVGRPYQLCLLEASDRVGGVVRTIKQRDFLLECGPDSFLTQKRHGMALCDELGLRRQLLETKPAHARSFIARGKKLIPVPEGFYLLGPTRLDTFLLSSVLSLSGKFRVLKEPLIPLRSKNANDANYDESLGSFVRRRFGREALERLAQPLVAGIYAADPEKLSLRSTFPRFLEMEQHGSVLKGLLRSKDPAMSGASGPRYSLFASFRDGMQVMTDRLAELLTPNVIKTRTVIRSLRPKTNGSGVVWHIGCENGDVLEVDAVCSALPAYASAFLLQGVDARLCQLLNGISYTDSATIQLGFRAQDIAHSMKGFGFVVPAVEKRFISACSFSQEKFEGRAPAGHALLRVFVGGATLTRFMGDDGELIRKALLDLRDLLGVRGQPVFSLVSRYRRALPLYAVGHHQQIAEIKDRIRQIPGLALAGNWTEGVGLPDCIESAEGAADGLWTHLSR